MDINKIKQVILSQINGTSSLYSLKIQNHIYGCFLIMEDIAQGVTSLNELCLIYPDDIGEKKKDFHLEEQFSEIGLRYGFIMDDKLELESFNAEYKAIWLDCFKTADLTHDINSVDDVEDAIIEMLTVVVPKENAFFINALDTGSLSDEWIGRVLKLLGVGEPTAQIDEGVANMSKNEALKPSESVDNMSEVVAHQAQVTAAANEKLICSHHRGKALHKTRRNIQIINVKKTGTTPKSKKKVLILTRRNPNRVK
jgi:hypothetical protein